MQVLLRSPVFASADLTQRARILHRVVTITMAVTTAVMGVLLVLQPDIRLRAFVTLALIDGAGLVALTLAHRGRVQAASWFFVLYLISHVSLLALAAGGIRSPGVGLFLVFVLMAGLLLGIRAGVAVAGVCTAVLAGLVTAEYSDWLPPQRVVYRPEVLLLLFTLYMGVVLALLQLASSSVRLALTRAEDELAERRHAERRRDLALEAGGINAWSYNVATRRFSSDDRGFEILGVPNPGREVPLEEWQAVVHPDDVRRATRACRPTIRPGHHLAESSKPMGVRPTWCVASCRSADNARVTRPPSIWSPSSTKR